MIDVDRMIEGMGGFFENSHVAFCVRGRAEDDFLKKVRRDVRRTRKCKKQAAFGKLLQGLEIDILVTGPRGPIMSFECKTSSETISDATHAVFRKRFPELPLFVASLKDVHPRKLENGATVLPWHQALDAFLA